MVLTFKIFILIYFMKRNMIKFNIVIIQFFIQKSESSSSVIIEESLKY